MTFASLEGKNALVTGGGRGIVNWPALSVWVASMRAPLVRWSSTRALGMMAPVVSSTMPVRERLFWAESELGTQNSRPAAKHRAAIRRGLGAEAPVRPRWLEVGRMGVTFSGVALVLV